MAKPENIEDDMLPSSEEETTNVDMGDVSLPEMPEESKGDTEKKDDQPETPAEEKKELENLPEKDKAEEKKETPADEKKEEDEEELDLSDLLSELSDSEKSIADSDKAIANIENADGKPNPEDVAALKEANFQLTDQVKNLEEKIRKLLTDKTDLVYKNAELEAFGGSSQDPQMLMLTRNLEKAKAGDDKAKSKAITILKETLTELTGEDYDQKSTEKKVDVLSAAESYNKSSNPALKDKKDAEDDVIVM